MCNKFSPFKNLPACFYYYFFFESLQSLLLGPKTKTKTETNSLTEARGVFGLYFQTTIFSF